MKIRAFSECRGAMNFKMQHKADSFQFHHLNPTLDFFFYVPGLAYMESRAPLRADGS